MDVHNTTIHRAKKSLILAKKLIFCVYPVDNSWLTPPLWMIIDLPRFDWYTTRALCQREPINQRNVAEIVSTVFVPAKSAQTDAMCSADAERRAEKS